MRGVGKKANSYFSLEIEYNKPDNVDPIHVAPGGQHTQKKKRKRVFRKNLNDLANIINRAGCGFQNEGKYIFVLHFKKSVKVEERETNLYGAIRMYNSQIIGEKNIGY